MTMVMPPDLELWLCTYLRAQLADVVGLKVSNREPDDYSGSVPLIVVRDDGGSQSDRLLFDRSVGVTVRYGPRTSPKKCRDLAARVYGLLTDPSTCLVEGSPIAGISEDGCNGPYAVAEDADIARFYMIFEFSAVGTVENTEI